MSKFRIELLLIIVSAVIKAVVSVLYGLNDKDTENDTE